MKNLSKTPLIYSDESDLKKMEIDLDEEDMDNEVDSDDDLDVWLIIEIYKLFIIFFKWIKENHKDNKKLLSVTVLALKKLLFPINLSIKINNNNHKGRYIITIIWSI